MCMHSSARSFQRRMTLKQHLDPGVLRREMQRCRDNGGSPMSEKALRGMQFKFHQAANVFFSHE